MSPTTITDTSLDAVDVEEYYREHPVAARWAQGYGTIGHTTETKARVYEMARSMTERGRLAAEADLFDMLHALDIVTSAAMWLVVHEVYACNVYLDGRPLAPEDFKRDPQGHTGGSLNLVPGYTGYMAANALTGITRSWIAGQGHCVSAVDSVNLLLDNLLPAHRERYSLSDEGLTRYVRDFYSYRLNSAGEPDSPLGSHVNPHTAGGMAEGGYLGFVQLQYAHMPLPGERLVTFLSDGAFEEQRGSDWVPRWWRAEDCGMVLPIMINNGRRIDQRSTLAQQGGTDWLRRHLRLNSFDPIVFDGTDPAAFVWAIYEMEDRLETATEALTAGVINYPASIPYGIAVSSKGAGFYNAGTNLAHDLPIAESPRRKPDNTDIFNRHTAALWVSKQEIEQAAALLQNHAATGRPKEQDHPLCRRDVKAGSVPAPDYHPVPESRSKRDTWCRSRPMFAVADMFLAAVRANPHLRPRVGNPDEMRSNRLQSVLDELKFRVTDPEKSVPEDIHGKVITALNEEAVAAAALGNKGGINLIATYEAFGAKMHGVVRQEIIFTRHALDAGQQPGWLSVPLFLTSHTWENGKNEQSHQDTAMAEAMMNEPSDVSRVVFPPDYNTAAALMQAVYATRAAIWTAVVSKRKAPDLFTPQEAEALVEHGALQLGWAGFETETQRPRLIITAVGSYQLEEVVRAGERLRDRGIPYRIVYMFEPGRFRRPRDRREQEHAPPFGHIERMYPPDVESRLFVVHTRPELFLGTVRPLDTGPGRTAALGFLNRGGTLDHWGLLFINRTTWAHILGEAARLMRIDPRELLEPREIDCLNGAADPQGVIIPVPER